MTQIFPFIQLATVEIDGVLYDDEVSNVTFTPTTTNSSWVPLSGKTASSGHVTGWNVAFTYGQDYDTPSSLASYVQANAGQPADIKFIPKGGAASPKSWNTTISALMPGNIGGGAGTAEATSTSPCITPVHEAYTPPV